MTTNLLSVIEQLVGALETCRIMAADDQGNYTKEVTPKIIQAALAAGKQALEQTQVEAVDIDALCARIKAADDACADMDYMLDSNDCISVLRGTWRGPLLNDMPPYPQATEPAPSTLNGVPPMFPVDDGSYTVNIEQKPAPSKSRVLVGDPVADFGEIAKLARLYLDSEEGKYSARSVLIRILGCALAEPAPSTAGECETPHYCQSVQRCTAMDEARAQPAQGERAESAFTEWWGTQLDDSPTYQATFAAGYNAALLSAPALPAAAMPVGELTDERIDDLRCRYTEKRESREDIRNLARAILAAASSQPVREPLPLMSEAFRTTVAHGPSEDYRMVFKFKDLDSLHAADDEWRKFRGAP